ncbi:MAG TPA: rhodanese-like domain-containing protein [Flavobacteriaceae bacterium]|nr:rhodanese-like domain-containing protein [Flavobacteriaceae bacterium]
MKHLKLIVLIFSLAIFGCKDEVNKSANNENTADTAETTLTATQNSEQQGEIILVTPEEAKKLMLSDNLQIVDVRTEKELKTGMIDGAENMIYEENFKEKMQSLDKSQPVLVYCHSGRRSAKCAKILQENGFEKIFDLKGGIKGWIKEGEPLVH